MKKFFWYSLLFPFVSLYCGMSTVFAAPIPKEEGMQLFQKAVEQSRKASYFVESPSAFKNCPDDSYWQIVGDDGVLRRRLVSYIPENEELTVIDNGVGTYVRFRDQWSRVVGWTEELCRFDDLCRGLDESVLEVSEYDREDISIDGVPVIQLSIKNVQPEGRWSESIVLRRVYLIRGDNSVIISRKLFHGDATEPVTAVSLPNPNFNPTVEEDFFDVPDIEMPVTNSVSEVYTKLLKQERLAAREQELTELKAQQNSTKIKSFFSYVGRFCMSTGGVVLILILSVIALGAAWLLRRRK